MKRYSTREVAEKLGLHSVTLHRYVLSGKVPGPAVEVIGGSRIRGWTDRDVERVRKILPKIANGRKTRYQKERAKKKRSKKASKKK
jgi:DNA-binding transcriptional MerR regulator